MSLKGLNPIYVLLCVLFGFIATGIKGHLTSGFGMFTLTYLFTLVIFTFFGFGLSYTNLPPLIILPLAALMEYIITRLVGLTIMNQFLSVNSNIQDALIFGCLAGAALGWIFYDSYQKKKLNSSEENIKTI